MVSHVSVAVFSVSGITYFRNRYHVNKLQGCEITFGNKFVSFSSLGGSVELRSGYVPFFSVFIHFLCFNYVNFS